MIDPHTRGLDVYERRMLHHDHIESAFNAEMEPYIRELENIAKSVKNLVRHYEDEYSLDFSDDAMSAIDEALR